MKIQFNANALMNLFTQPDFDKSQMHIAMALYDAANRHESASDTIKRHSERIRESLDEIERGRIPTWNIAEKATEIERLATEQKEARRLFETIAKISGYEVASE